MTLTALDPRTQSKPLPTSAAYAAALVGVAVATGLALIGEQIGVVRDLGLIFVLPVVIVAVAFGWGPSLAAALLGVAAFNFFLIEPRYTFRVADPANLWSLGLLLVVAAIVCTLAADARRRAVQAIDHADQALALQGLARGLITAPDSAAILRLVAEALQRVFKAPSAVVLAEGAGWRTQVAEGDGFAAADMDAAQWSLAANMPSRGGDYPVDGARYDFWPVRAAGVQAALGVALAETGLDRPAHPARLVEIVGGYLAVALERERLAGEVMAAELRRRDESARAELLAAVSHDLRTPLSTILLSLQSLRRFGDLHDAAARDQLLAVTETEATRLSAMVSGLLDMSRVEAGAVVARPAPVPLTDFLEGAIAAAAASLADHRLVFDAAGADALLLIDPTLAQSALANVLENAGKYAPKGSVVTIRTVVGDTVATVEVLDQGPGFPTPVSAMFDRFVRGVSGDGRPPGVGLGLSIARGFLAAQGATIEAGERPEGGAWVRLALPLAKTA